MDILLPLSTLLSLGIAALLAYRWSQDTNDVQADAVPIPVKVDDRH